MALTKFQDVANQNGQSVITSGTQSSTKAGKNLPLATVTIYEHGTLTLASIFTDDTGSTPKANPLTAASDASYFFYAEGGRYDIRVAAAGGSPAPFTISDVLVGSEGVGTRIIIANDMDGAPDVGAQINAADALLGSDAGLIYYFGGGNLATPVHLSSGHTLHLGDGTYTSDASFPPFWMDSDTTIEGDGWGTILEETSVAGLPDGRSFVIITSFAQLILNGSTQRNMIVRDLQLVGVQAAFNSAPQAVQLGNCHGGLVENVYFNGTNSIGVQAGAVSTAGNDPLSLGRFSEDITIRGCAFYRVASQNIAFVNTRNSIIQDNIIRDPGQTGGPGVTPIDCEVNDFANDKMEGIVIKGNICDSRNSELNPHGNFIAYQPSTPGIGFEISDNILLGGARVSNAIITNACRQGIIAGNIFIGCGQSGIAVNGGVNLKITDNLVIDCGTGGVPTFNFDGCDQIDFTDNTAFRTTSSAAGNVVSTASTNISCQGNNLNGTGPGFSVGGVGSVVGANIVAGVWQFGQAGLTSGPSFVGNTSGSTKLQASAVAGATTQTLPAVTGVLASTTGTNLFLPDLKRCSASLTKNASAAYANVTGLSFTVVPGTYAFVCELASTVASGTGGIKYAFNYTTAVVSVLEATGIGHTASAVAVQHTTTTTTQTDLFTQAAVVIHVRIVGTMVVTTGGTVDVQMAQNTSDASNTIALIGSWAQFTRIA